jgi:hypothetical protein
MWLSKLGLAFFQETQKGIVSRNLHVGFYYHSMILSSYTYGAIRVLFKFRFRVEFFDFRISA